MNVASLIAELNERVPFSAAEAWDPVGLTIGSPAGDARRLAVCHEVTEDVVGAVEASGFDTLVAYHPLLFEPTTRLIDGPSPQGRAVRLVRAGVSLVVVHTAFDAAVPGTGDALADALGLAVTGSFGAVDGSPIGRTCATEQIMSPAALGDLVSSRLGVEVKVAGGGRPIANVALVPGSGSSLIDEAMSFAEALITGDVSHHRARYAADHGLTVVDAGHAATERPGIEALYSLVRDIVDDATLLDDDPSPWKD